MRGYGLYGKVEGGRQVHEIEINKNNRQLS